MIAIALLLASVAFGLWRWLAITPAFGGAQPRHVTGSFAKVASGTGDLRIMVASSTPYIDRSGQMWARDQFFTGGTVVVRPSERILRTLDPDLYRHIRHGDFRYDIPLAGLLRTSSAFC
jgi:hypothetical protein